MISRRIFCSSAAAIGLSHGTRMAQSRWPGQTRKFVMPHVLGGTACVSARSDAFR